MGTVNLRKNLGVLPPPENSKEYWLGAVSGIVHEDRNTVKDWRGFLPTNERQAFRYFDSMGCASFSCLNSIETQFDFLLRSNLLRDEDIQWLKDNNYFDENGKLNLSDRWLVVLSNTIPGVGNYLHAVWDAARKFGFVPQGTIPFSDEMSQQQYYNKTDFSKSAYELGQEFLKRFYIQYERVATDNVSIKKALGQAPLHVGVPTCEGWFDSAIVATCNAKANHAVLLTAIDETGKFIFDSYDPYQKKVGKTYHVYFAYKGVVSPIVSVGGRQKSNFRFMKNLKWGDYDNDVVELAKRLIEEDCWSDTQFNPPTPHYGPEIARAVRNYQRKNRITTWLEDVWYKGRYCGFKTRFYLNGAPLKW